MCLDSNDKNISRTKVATMSYDRSNERAYSFACVDASGILINLELEKRQIKDLSFYFYFLNSDILLNNELPVI